MRDFLLPTDGQPRPVQVQFKFFGLEFSSGDVVAIKLQGAKNDGAVYPIFASKEGEDFRYDKTVNTSIERIHLGRKNPHFEDPYIMNPQLVHYRCGDKTGMDVIGTIQNHPNIKGGTKVWIPAPTLCLANGEEFDSQPLVAMASLAEIHRHNVQGPRFGYACPLARQRL